MNTINFKQVKKQVNENNELTGYLVDGMSVPLAEGNRHYKQVLQWIEQGGEVQEAYTQEELDKQAKDKALVGFNNAILTHLDTQCKTLGFTGDDKTRPYRAVANYVGFDNVFRVEAEKLGGWIALVFQTAEKIQADVQSGVRDMPTVDEVIAELPVYEGDK